MIGKVVVTLSVLAIIFLPLIAGDVSFPNSLDSNALGHFLTSWVNYWLSLFRTLFSELTRYIASLSNRTFSGPDSSLYLV